MAYVAVAFIILALLEIFAACLIFIFKDMLHSVLALAFVFIFNSAMFLVMQQPLLAVMQLFIMVGGVATYAFVGVSSVNYSKFKHTNYFAFGIIFILLFVSMAYRAVQAATVTTEQNTLSISLITKSLGLNIGILYLIALMLFGVGFGSILLMKKIGAKK
jgi:NADH:ubiquinone oxidoreductase subunit 6 (subunit J)